MVLTHAPVARLSCIGDCRYQVDHYNTDPKFRFRVDEMTGVVTIRDQLDVDVPRSFSLHILAIDEGTTLENGVIVLY